VPLFANGLQLRHNALPLALGRGQEFITWAAVLCGTAKRGCSCPLWVKSGHRGTCNRCPLYPQKQTFCAGKKMSLFDHLVGAAKPCLQHRPSAGPTSVAHRYQPNSGTLEGISIDKNFKIDAAQQLPRCSLFQF